MDFEKMVVNPQEGYIARFVMGFLPVWRLLELMNPFIHWDFFKTRIVSSTGFTFDKFADNLKDLLMEDESINFIRSRSLHLLNWIVHHS